MGDKIKQELLESWRVILERGKENLIEEDFQRVWCIQSMYVIYKLEEYISHSKQTYNGNTKDDAIIYGYLVRLFNLLRYERRLVCKNVASSLIISILERCVLESCITLEYLLCNQDVKRFDDFRIQSLRLTRKGEKEVNNRIAKNNGITSETERGILESIYKEYEKIGIKGEDIDNWSNGTCTVSGFLGRFQNVGKETIYNIAYKSKTQVVHGNWEELSKNCLSFDEETSKFYPDLSDINADIRQLNPLLLLIINTIKVFIDKYKGHGFDEYKEIEELDIISDSIANLEREHETFLGRS